MSTDTRLAHEPIDDVFVADLVATDPRRAAVFERLGIDYCCGGKLPLSQATTEHGLDLADVRQQLAVATADVGETRDWSTATIEELVADIIDNHHGFLRAELPRLTLLAQKVARAHGAGNPNLVVAEHIVVQMVEELRTHTDEEENEVFPACLAIAAGEIADAPKLAAQLRSLVDDHTEAATYLTQLRGLLDDFVPPATACTSFRAYLDLLDRFEQDLHRHVHKENHILFDRVMDQLSVESSMPGTDA